MSDVLTELYNACDPLRPASARQYVDATPVRGGNAFTRSFLNQLSHASASPGSYLRVLFSGHIGSGKSSELEHLQHTLADGQPTSSGKRFVPVLLDAEEYLDQYDVATTDILLAIVAELAATLKAEKGIELKDSYFQKRLNEVRQFFLSDVEMSEGELPLWGAKAKLRLLKAAPEAREQVRQALRLQVAGLLSEVNAVFDEARLRLNQQAAAEGRKQDVDIVLILDNLEKIERIEDDGTGDRAPRALFIERASQFTRLNIHLVLTVPLRLVRTHGPQLERIYGKSPSVLPMIKVESRGSHEPFSRGLECLRTILRRRAGEVPLEQIFEEPAIEWLLRYSGGHVRDLMGFVQRACSEVDRPPITLRAAQRALNQTVALFSTSISPARWAKLAQLECSPNQQIDNSDPDYQMLLEELAIFEYINGGQEDNPFDPAAPWYVVNPIVRELSQFKRAVEAERIRVASLPDLAESS